MYFGQEKYYMCTSSIRFLSGKDFIITGTYSKGKNKAANGIYFAKYVDDKQVALSRFSFSDLEGFYELVGGGRTGFNRMGNTERSTDKKKEKGKTDFLNALILSHMAIPFEDHFVYIGECYYEIYRTDYSGTTKVTKLDSYKFTHALVMGVDAEGKKLYHLTFRLPSHGYQKRLSAHLTPVLNNKSIDI